MSFFKTFEVYGAIYDGLRITELPAEIAAATGKSAQIIG